MVCATSGGHVTGGALRRAPPRLAIRARQQQEVRTEQVDGGNLLIAALEPDMRRAVAWPRRGHIFA